MKTTDFAYYLTNFLSIHLSSKRNASTNTIASYRDTFMLFLLFMDNQHGIKSEKLSLDTVTKEKVESFLDWLEIERSCKSSTRNVRLAAIHSFFRYLQYKMPEKLKLWQDILSIPAKKHTSDTFNYVSLEGIKLILEQPNQEDPYGKRDVTLLSLMYDSAARVQEIIDITPEMIRFDHPSTIKLIGKGRKARIVPMMEEQTRLLRSYMEDKKLTSPEKLKYPIFTNHKNEKMTRAGVNYILAKYADMARSKEPSLIPEKLSCHCIRHSKSMHLLQAGVNLVYIRDLLGHESVQTTQIYARADSKQKREALENAYVNLSPDVIPTWQDNQDLMSWLKGF